MSGYCSLKPHVLILTDETTGSLRQLHLTGDNLDLETVANNYLQRVNFDSQGLKADMPAAGMRGRYYYCTDSDELFRDDGSTWNLINDNTRYRLQGAFADRPDAGIQGRRYFATDLKIAYIDNGTAWEALGAAMLDNRVSVYMSANQTVAASTTAKLAFDTAIYDPKSLFDSANNRIVIADAGLYLVNNFTKDYVNVSGYTVDTYIYKNGAEFIHTTLRAESENTNGVHAILDLATNDYLEIYKHNGDGSYDMTVTGDQETSRFELIGLHS